MKCPYCGTDNREGAMFCSKCGYDFDFELEFESASVPDADTLVKTAESYAELENYVLAKEAWAKVIDNYPKDYRGWFGRLKLWFQFIACNDSADGDFMINSVGSDLEHALDCLKTAHLTDKKADQIRASFVKFFNNLMEDWESRSHSKTISFGEAAEESLAGVVADSVDYDKYHFNLMSYPHFAINTTDMAVPTRETLWLVSRVSALETVAGLLGDSELLGHVKNLNETFAKGYTSGRYAGGGYRFMKSLAGKETEISAAALLKILQSMEISCKISASARGSFFDFLRRSKKKDQESSPDNYLYIGNVPFMSAMDTIKIFGRTLSNDNAFFVLPSAVSEDYLRSLQGEQVTASNTGIKKTPVIKIRTLEL